MTNSAPRSILIVGHGVFGLSTALALTQRPLYANTKISLVDRSPFPSPDGSSIDTSRIVRADYADLAYASLAAEAQLQWRQQETASDLGAEGRYTETGLVLVSCNGQDDADGATDVVQGEAYVDQSFENVKQIAAASGDEGAIEVLASREAIDKVVGTGGGSGTRGYVNWRSGWADAEAGMRWLRKQVEATGLVTFYQGEVRRLVREDHGENRQKVTGVKLADGSVLSAELVILATGAWTGKLVDLRGRAQATGQVLGYLDLTEEEQAQLGKMPVLLNMSSGCFIVPPRNRELKVARHGYGYSNPQLIANPDTATDDVDTSVNGDKNMIQVSLPRTSWEDKDQGIPKEGEEALRRVLGEMIPSLHDRPFTKTRICWYTDTPHGDFLITHHPHLSGLFLATGGSGHGYKFLPVIGGRIVDALSGVFEPAALEEQWSWSSMGSATITDERGVPLPVVTEDGSRGGRLGMLLTEEMERK